MPVCAGFSVRTATGSLLLILLPGAKSTISDLKWLRQSGLESAILKSASSGTLVIGICGGYQMLGERILDPDQVEASGTTEVVGMGLLPIQTVFRGEKVQAQVSGVLQGIEGMLEVLNGMEYRGYELHMGRSGDGIPVIAGQGNVLGSYVHGIFDATGITDAVLTEICRQKGIAPEALGTFDMTAYKERQYDILANAVRKNMDMKLVYRILNREV